MGVHALEVRQHDVAVKAVAMFDERVLHHGVSHPVLVVTGDVEAAPGARLRVGHLLIQTHPDPLR